MKATLKLEDGREIAVELNEETLKQIEKPEKRTGYEVTEEYYTVDGNGSVYSVKEPVSGTPCRHNVANRYSDKTVAENNSKADTLMRKLRRFVVEHRKTELNWWDDFQVKYEIYYGYGIEAIKVTKSFSARNFGSIYFDTEETAKAAIEEFKDELIWYFTEYKDSL